MKQTIDEGVTFLKSNTFRMYLAILLLVFARAFNLQLTSYVLLIAVGWFAGKAHGDQEVRNND